MASVKTRNGNVSGDLKVPRYSCPRLSDAVNRESFMPSTGLKTRGYLTSRLCRRLMAKSQWPIANPKP